MLLIAELSRPDAHGTHQINAETTAGGIAHWATSLVASELRTNATDFKEAWTPYVEGIAAAVKPNQVSSGGPIIGRSCQLECKVTLY